MLLSIPNIKYKKISSSLGPSSLPPHPSSSITHFDCSRFHGRPSLIPLFFCSLVRHLSLIGVAKPSLASHHSCGGLVGRIQAHVRLDLARIFVTSQPMQTQPPIYHTFITSQIAVSTFMWDQPYKLSHIRCRHSYLFKLSQSLDNYPYGINLLLQLAFIMGLRI